MEVACNNALSSGMPFETKMEFNSSSPVFERWGVECYDFGSTIKGTSEKAREGGMTVQQTMYKEDIDVFREDVSITRTREGNRFVHCLYYKKLAGSSKRL